MEYPEILKKNKKTIIILFNNTILSKRSSLKCVITFYSSRTKQNKCVMMDVRKVVTSDRGR